MQKLLPLSCIAAGILSCPKQQNDEPEGAKLRFDSVIGTEQALSAFLICTAVSLIPGIGVACVGMYRPRSTPGFAINPAILPAVVQLVLMPVNTAT